MHLIAALLLLAPGLPSRPAAGDSAPAFSLPSSDGGVVSLADFEGKKVVVAFFPKAFTGG